MQILQSSFVGSTVCAKQVMKPGKPIFAFVGRSNVGKSSLINSLLNRKKLAKTSSTPGKTRLINYFIVNESWYLVDLPGYGWAKVSQAQRKKFANMMVTYLKHHPMLLSVFVLVDSRHAPQDLDIAFINWLGSERIPFAIVLTKTDKISSQKAQVYVERLEAIMLKHWESLPPFFMTSAKKRQGHEALITYMQKYCVQ